MMHGRLTTARRPPSTPRRQQRRSTYVPACLPLSPIGPYAFAPCISSMVVTFLNHIHDAQTCLKKLTKTLSALEALVPLQGPGKLEASISFVAFATLSVLFQTARLDESGAPQHATEPLKDFLQAKHPIAKALKVIYSALCGTIPDEAALRAFCSAQRRALHAVIGQ